MKQYDSVVYFAGPRSKWSGKVSEDEIIARRQVPFLWAGLFWARSACRQLNMTRVGIAVSFDGTVVFHQHPKELP